MNQNNKVIVVILIFMMIMGFYFLFKNTKDNFDIPKSDGSLLFNEVMSEKLLNFLQNQFKLKGRLNVIGKHVFGVGPLYVKNINIVPLNVIDSTLTISDIFDMNLPYYEVKFKTSIVLASDIKLSENINKILLHTSSGLYGYYATITVRTDFGPHKDDSYVLNPNIVSIDINGKQLQDFKHDILQKVYN